MKRYYKLFNFRALLFSFSALLFLASCSSYQYAGYEDDGIYSSNRNEAYTANDYEESYENALYYQQLFAEKADQFGNVPEEGAIFTDIESYNSGAYDDNFEQEDLDYVAGRAAWGSDPDEISVNIYNDPFYRGYYRPYYTGFYDPFYYPGYYYGYGYYPHYYNSWRFSIGWGYGWNSWGYGYPHYRYGYGGYYHPYYHYPYYSHRRVAYNTSRRDGYSDYNTRRESYSDYRSNRTRLDARSSRIGRYTNPRSVRADGSTYDRRTYQTRTRRVNSDYSTQRRSNPSYNTQRSSNRRSATQVRTTRSRNNNTSVRRSSRSSGNNNTSVRRSSRSSGNNSSVRSSSSSSRSSGSSGSSRSSRGRGN